HRPVESPGTLQVVLDQMGEDLGVGLGLELVTLGQEVLLDLEVILDDAVVDDDQRAGAVGVRMRVLLGRRAVSRPARVSEAERARQRALTEHALEHLEPAGRAPDVQRAVVEDRDARGVVAAILESPQPLDDDADRTLVPDVADDSTHGCPQCSSRFLALRAAQPSLTICWARPTARAPGGTSLVIVEPAPI